MRNSAHGERLLASFSEKGHHPPFKFHHLEMLFQNLVCLLFATLEVVIHARFPLRFIIGRLLHTRVVNLRCGSQLLLVPQMNSTHKAAVAIVVDDVQVRVSISLKDWASDPVHEAKMADSPALLCLSPDAGA